MEDEEKLRVEQEEEAAVSKDQNFWSSEARTDSRRRETPRKRNTATVRAEDLQGGVTHQALGGG